MGTPREPKPAKYFVALLSSSREILSQAENDLRVVLGDIDARTPIVPWNLSRYYEREMGSGLLRGFAAFSRLLSPERLAEIKLETQLLEERYRQAASVARQINIDPGYLDAYKVVLASTKNASQRLYLCSGIYAEATLFYNNRNFHGLAYTYRDYLWPETLDFFVQLRAAYLMQLRQLGLSTEPSRTGQHC